MEQYLSTDNRIVMLYLLKGGMQMRVGFIGAGKVGCSLGKYFVENGIEVSGYYSRTFEASKEAAEFTLTGKYETLESILEDSDTLFLTVPDRQISKVWDDMRGLDIRDKIICHCSGSISSATFFNGEKRGAKVYSVHPLYAISDRFSSWKNLKNAYFVIEGSESGMEIMRSLMQVGGNQVIVTDTAKKSLYHGAAVTASNLVVALLKMSVDMLNACGFEEKAAMEALKGLFLGNAEAMVEKGLVDALTGPVERNDVETVQRHLQAFRQETGMQNAEMIYRLLSMELLDIAKQKHKDRDYGNLTEILCASFGCMEDGKKGGFADEEYSDDI